MHLLMRTTCDSMAVRIFCSSTAPVTDKDKEEVTEYFNNNGFERWNKVHMSTAALRVIMQSAPFS
jgi:hypothetical protein